MPIIRYGSSRYFGFDNPQVNTLQSIIQASNKSGALTVLNNHGITVPKYYAFVDAEEIKYPVLARKTFHKQGRDIILCNNREEAVNALHSGRDYLLEFIEARAEYRLHCIDNEIVKIFRKVRLSPDSHDFIKCTRCGWGFYRTDMGQDWLQPMKSKAIESLKALGLYFGAVDMIHSTNHRFVVLEVNSAPALNTDTLNVYTKKLHHWLEKNYEMEPIRGSKTHRFRVKNNP